ncbi:Mrp/NBP35 family ATP-binding protein [Fimbriiglobus ruber]|uniref:Iron-sulfur cluster carrier protein n=1 Tax=Fimbriiglobus ruber TaxID=1908690 RepID=A0A225DG78_9BACT|nr:Mrp/NBP35 family ATP-binding protein [Fimbriiglobus ruber]OWK35097.1 Cytosolic Fe-S cluster assembling factor NBP35 / Chromosome (plasmid) partitioning protein ParA [Fimbriiglobus ruber]
MSPPMPGQKFSLPGVKHVIAVASGKGGVGKSTVAANLAVALHMHGQRIGLMDADIYGPSVPMMFGLGLVDQTRTPFPIERQGLKLMSMGFLVDPNQAVIWRGPKVAQAVGSFLVQIPWGDLDFLIIDLPPGTGDAQLTLSQQAPLTGAIVVTTPQDVSLIDARKGVRMFQEVRVPVLGVVENMSYFVGDDGKRYEIFRSGGGKKLAAEAGVSLLGELPIDPRVAECGDAGEPIVSKYPDSVVAKAYVALAQSVLNEMKKRPTTDALPEVEL